MAKFHFKLQPVLKFRQQREEALKKELARWQRFAAQEEARLAELEDALWQQVEEMRVAQQANVDVGQLQLLQSYNERLRRERAIQRVRVVEAHKAVEQRRLETVKAAQERETMERLRERKRVEFEAEELRLEQGVIDELATQRHNRHGESQY